jgi:hypothetical protein
VRDLLRAAKDRGLIGLLQRHTATHCDDTRPAGPPEYQNTCSYTRPHLDVVVCTVRSQVDWTAGESWCDT